MPSPNTRKTTHTKKKEKKNPQRRKLKNKLMKCILPLRYNINKMENLSSNKIIQIIIHTPS